MRELHRAIKLNQAKLSSLPANVSVPRYKRDDITPGIIHIGVGNFHRGHQAIYLDRLFELGHDHDWGVLGAGIKSYDKQMRDELAAQDWLTTIVELDAEGLSARVCGSMVGFIDVNATTLVAELVNPQIRIVSLTITEGGYYINEETGGFLIENSEIQADIINPRAPRTVFGILVTALALRREAGLLPFTIMSCDNAPHNGQITQQAVVGLAQAMNPELTAWIEDTVCFPNSMVDCIVPATSDRERRRLRRVFGIEDAAPVFCEPFRQWILEDKFVQGRPALEKVGVQFVNDVAPFELMKLRILNGGHIAIAYAAALLNIHFVHDAMANPLLAKFLRKVEETEIVPAVPAVPGVNLYEYAKLIEKRFSNPEIGDTISRLCLDGSNKLPKFILPVIATNVTTGRPCPGLFLVVALWCRYCAAVGEDGSTIDLADPQAERLKKTALQAKSKPDAFLEKNDIFGTLGHNEEFRAQFSAALNTIWQNGTQSALEAYI